MLFEMKFIFNTFSYNFSFPIDYIHYLLNSLGTCVASVSNENPAIYIRLDTYEAPVIFPTEEFDLQYKGRKKKKRRI